MLPNCVCHAIQSKKTTRHLYIADANILPACILIYGDKMHGEIRITSWENTGTTTISIRTGFGVYHDKDRNTVLLRVHK